MFKVWKKARQLLKEEAELRKNIRAIRKADLSYETLEQLINKVAYAVNPVALDVVFADGTKMTIRPTTKNEINYQSFRDQWEANRQKTRHI